MRDKNTNVTKAGENCDNITKYFQENNRTIYATKAQDGLGLTRISEFWTALKISWLRRFCSSNSFWIKLKCEWLRNLGCADLEPRCTDSKVVELICKKCPNPFWKNVYKGFKICVSNYLEIFPKEFIYLPLYNQKEITGDLIPVEQPWCKNLMIADIIDDKLEFRHRSVITMSPRKIKDYEYKS